MCYNFRMRKTLLVIFTVLSITTFIISRSAYSVESCDHTCSKCHQVTNEDITNLLKESIPDVKVLDVRPAQVKGLIEVVLESKGGQKGILYMDSSKKYIVSGSIIDVKTKANFTQERYNEVNKADISKIPLDDALVMGDKDAKYRVIVFDDPE